MSANRERSSKTASKKTQRTRRGTAAQQTLLADALVELKQFLAKTPHQGHSFHEVFCELKRRYDGERELSQKAKDRAFVRALRVLIAQFVLSLVVDEMQKTLSLSTRELQHVCGDEKGMSCVSIILNPYPAYKQRRPGDLALSADVDDIYPGTIWKDRKKAAG